MAKNVGMWSLMSTSFLIIFTKLRTTYINVKQHFAAEVSGQSFMRLRLECAFPTSEFVLKAVEAKNQTTPF